MQIAIQKNDFINILSLEKLKTLDSLDIAVNFLPSIFISELIDLGRDMLTQYCQE